MRLNAQYIYLTHKLKSFYATYCVHAYNYILFINYGMVCERLILTTIL